MADNDTFRYLGGLALESFLAYMCDWVCTTWETTGPELAVLKLSWPCRGGLFGVIFGIIFGVMLDTVRAIKSRLRLYDARVTK